jgi:hypothetical protein
MQLPGGAVVTGDKPKPAAGTEARRRHDRKQAEKARECRAVWDGQRCGKVLDLDDLLDNESGYCADCAGILSDNGEW